MFSDNERNELIGLILLELEKNEVGRIIAKEINVGDGKTKTKRLVDSTEEGRQAVAQMLVDLTRKFLKGKYNTNFGEDNKTKGIYQTRDIITKDDFSK